MNIRLAFVANLETATPPEPGQGALHNPAMSSQAIARLDATTGNPAFDSPPPKVRATARDIIPFVGVQLLGASPWSPRTPAPQGRDGIEERLEEAAIVDVGRAREDGQRDPASVYNQVALRARFAPVGWVGAGLLAAVLRGDARAVEAHAAPVDPTGIVQAVEQGMMESLPHACLVPIAQSSPAGHPAPAIEFLWEHLPGDT